MNDTLALTVGWSLGLIGGGLAAWAFRRIVVWKWELGDKPFVNLKRIPGWLTGMVERAVFMSAIIVGIDDIPTAMMAWLGLKLAANWARYDSEKAPKSHTWAMLALLCGFISLAFAYLGATCIEQGLFVVPAEQEGLDRWLGN